MAALLCGCGATHTSESQYATRERFYEQREEEIDAAKRRGDRTGAARLEAQLQQWKKHSVGLQIPPPPELVGKWVNQDDPEGFYRNLIIAPDGRVEAVPRLAKGIQKIQGRVIDVMGNELGLELACTAAPIKETDELGHYVWLYELTSEGLDLHARVPTEIPGKAYKLGAKWKRR